jgi:hypothetical protein
MSGTGRFSTEAPASTESVLAEVGEERERQYAKWGPQHHPDGTALDGAKYLADKARERCDEAAREGRVDWNYILTEEFLEARAEDPDTAGLRKELLQVAAVCVAWVEDIDSRPQHADVHDLGGEG